MMIDSVPLERASDAAAADRHDRGIWIERAGLAILAVLLFAALPLTLDVFRLGLAAKYLSLAFCAIGIVLIWGYGGILSLGQGVFFGLGSYMMAMFLKLESTSSGSSAQALSSFFGSNLPDFMVWNSVETLPWWWEPFHYVWFTIPAILLLRSEEHTSE